MAAKKVDIEELITALRKADKGEGRSNMMNAAQNVANHKMDILMGEEIKDDIREIKGMIKDDRDKEYQARRDIDTIHERHKQEDKHLYPERISKLEKYKYTLTGIFAVIVFAISSGGYYVITSAVENIVKEELADHNDDIEKEIISVLKDYEFELTK